MKAICINKEPLIKHLKKVPNVVHLLDIFKILYQKEYLSYFAIKRKDKIYGPSKHNCWWIHKSIFKKSFKIIKD